MTRRNHIVAWFTSALIVVAALLIGDVAFAQVDLGLEPLTETGLGNVDPRVIIARIIRALLGFLGVVAVSIIIYGGVIWMTASGREASVEKAQKIIVNAVVGLVIILSSLAITQFIINRLASATGLSGSGTSSTSDLIGPGSSFGGSGFTLRTITPSGAVPIRNVVVQIAFSSSVDTSTIDNNIIVRPDGSDTPVPGTVTPSGSVLRFVPDAPCPSPNETLKCFAADAPFEVIVGGGLKGNNGAFVDCGIGGCTGTFSTGSLVDVTPPNVRITYPVNRSAVSADIDVPVSIQVTDDSGVGLVEGFADDVAFGTDAPTPTTASFVAGIPWDTGSYLPNSEHFLDSTATDIAGFSADASSVRVLVRPAHCFNGVLDTGFGETGIDCGGDSTSDDYCGACDGDACTTDADCSGGFCIDGICRALPQITQVLPDNGAPNNFITIAGSQFGSSRGSVTFLGDPTTDADDTVAGFACADGWDSTEVIVSVPDAAVSGPLSLVTSSGVEERTDDTVGPILADFTVNSIVRPGLCSISPNGGSLGMSVTFSGDAFGVANPASNVFFDSTAAGSITSWSTESIVAVVPPMASGVTNATVWAGTESSNPVSFTVVDLETGAGPTIAYVDPSSGPIGEYITVFGSNFGSAESAVMFSNPDGREAAGDSTFPAQCTGATWSMTQITVKVPKEYINETAVDAVTHNLRVVRSDGEESEPVGFEVASGEAGPGICALSPISGPVGTTVNVYGERFGSTTATLEFSSEVAGVTSLWSANNVTTTVPVEAVTGPVTVTVSSDESNGVNFAVGGCDPASVGACGAGYLCCPETLACTLTSVGCDTGPDTTNYLFEFSTGDIPVVPYIIRQCSDSSFNYSPSPWNGRPGGNEVCNNAVVSGYFNIPVIGMSASSIHVESCTGDPTAGDVCDVSADVPGLFAFNTDNFLFTPSDPLAPSTVYRVTVDDSITSLPPALEPMAEPYEFFFTTRTNPAPCEVTEVVVVPDEVNLTDIGDGVVGPNDLGDANLSALGVGAQQCVLVNLPEPAVWSLSNNPGPAVQYEGATTGSPVIVRAYAETLAGSAQAIAALVSQGLSGIGLVNVNFADPEVQAFWPNCGTACFGADICAQFNVAMKTSGPGALSAATVSFEECVNEVCEAGPSSPRAFSVNILEDDKRLQIVPTPALDPTTDAGKYYRVTIDGSVQSASGVELTGLNAPGEFTWIFRMDADGNLCTIDRVDVVPSSAVLTFIGERQEVSTNAYGPPDDCSENGQRVFAGGYDWLWASSNINTAILLGPLTPAAGDLDLATTLAPGCTDNCTLAGSMPNLQECGNGVLEGVCSDDISTTCSLDSDCSALAFCNLTIGEECDDNNLAPGDGCSPSCLREGSSACADPDDPNCCGNGSIDIFPVGWEECDDKNSVSGDGCSASCLREGAASVGAQCGNNSLAQLASGAGEDCDDGNTVNGDGCSSQCLAEGSEDRLAVCANGAIEPGEDCDDGNIANGDGCSSACLFEGSEECVADGGPNTRCCGNSVVESVAFEQCDGGEGCSDECLLLGSSIEYGTPSLCGDATLGDGLGNAFGESAQCDGASLTAGGDGNVDYMQVAQTATAAAISSQPIPADGLYSTDISAQEVISSESGTSPLYVSCTCQQSSDCSTNGSTIACGQATSCCFPRPTVTGFVPPPVGNQCRNVAVSVTFSEEMDTSTLVARVPNANGVEVNVPQIALRLSNAPAICPDGYVTEADLLASRPAFFASIGSFIDRIRSVMSPGAEALVAGECYLPASLNAVTVGNATEVAINYSQPLEPNEQYTIEVFGDSTTGDAIEQGVLNLGGVGLVAVTDGVAGSQSFTTGSKICELDRLIVEDISVSPGLFLAAAEMHDFEATPMTLANGPMEEIVPLTGVYDWDIEWTVTDSGDIVDIPGVLTGDSVDVFSQNESGIGSVFADATITVDTLNPDDPTTAINESSVGKVIDGGRAARVFLCEVPWPDNPSTELFEAPLNDALGNNDGISVGNQWTNFSTLYCRASVLEPNALGVPVIPPTALPDFLVTEVNPAQIASPGVVKEFILRHPTKSEGIGIRVSENPDYLPVELWYSQQGFEGALKPIIVDGFRGIQDGRTTYVHAVNPGSGIAHESMIYAISHSQGASPETIDVYNQMVSNMIFVDRESNPILNERVCAGVQDAEDVSCSTDVECIAELGPTATCSAEKDMMTRDLMRIEDMRTMEVVLNAYADTNKHCSVTSNLFCVDDAQCPGNETCNGSVPLLDAGTFIPRLTTSAWPSWNAELGNILGRAMPSDPINLHGSCPTGFDPTTCWDSINNIYQCSEASHVYMYQSIGIDSWRLRTDLERYQTFATMPFNPLPNSLGVLDIRQLSAPSYPAVANFCSNSTSSQFGVSTTCGDGLLGGSEVCEIGQTSIEACTDTFDGVPGPGIRITGCDANCANFINDLDGDGSPDSACIQAGCGNGVIEGTCSVSGALCTSDSACPGAETCDFTSGEECDDGSFNGTYGFCGIDCTNATSQLCGDGVVNGAEVCDLGAAVNGTYNSGCTWDCASTFGPQCGDEIVQEGNEICDGGFEPPYSGALCYDASLPPYSGSKCTVDSDCGASETCGGIPSRDPCPQQGFCVGGATPDATCIDDSGCTGGGFTTDGVCTIFNTYRSRSCDAACSWDTWSACVQQGSCGDNNVDPGEQCDDGNTNNGDSCTNLCQTNVCGDGFMNPALESCDFGEDNGNLCSPGQDDSCNYCTSICTYETVSGGFCGDGIVNGAEICDGSPPKFWVNTTSGAQGTTCDPSDPPLAGHECVEIGACNGGTNNGNLCVDSISGLGCPGGGSCVVASCDASCGSSCPSNYQAQFVLGQPWYSNNLAAPIPIPGEPFDGTLELFSYQRNGQCRDVSAPGDVYYGTCSFDSQCTDATNDVCEFLNAPDMAQIEIPACTVGTSLIADVDYDIQYPEMEIVFLIDTSNSMNTGLGNSTRWDIAMEALQNAITDLYDQYPGVLRIGAVSFGGTVPSSYYIDDDDDNLNGICENSECTEELNIAGGTRACGAQPFYSSSAGGYVWPEDWEDITSSSTGDTRSGVSACVTSVPVDVSEHNVVSNAISAIASPQGGTPLAGGFDLAHRMIENYPNDHQRIIILLSDGVPWCPVENDNTDPNYVPQSDGDCAISAQWVTDITDDIKSDGIEVYTAYFGNTSSVPQQCAQRSMTRWSSDCPVLTLPVIQSQLSTYTNGCTGVYYAGGREHTCLNNEDYSYSGNSATAFDVMFQNIINRIINPQIEIEGPAGVGSSQLYQGPSVSIPLPPGFSCDPTDSSTSALNFDFFGTGTVELDNIRFLHCAP